MSCRSGIIRKVRTARWDRFGRPSELPKYGLSGFPDDLVVRCRQGRTGSASDLEGFSAHGAILPPACARSRRRRAERRAVSSRARAADGGHEAHGISAFGDLKYPADFDHFDYVNADAPKGGMFSPIPSTRAYNQSYQTFNSLNAYILKGDGAQGMEHDVLAADGARRPTSRTRCTASSRSSVRISPDKLTYRFTLRPEARFHDGSKLTAHDVAFSLTTLKTKGHPPDRGADARHGRRPRRSTTRRWSSPSRRTRARDVPLLCRRPADLLEGLLRDAAVRRDDAGYAARLRALQGRASSRSTATSNSTASRTGGAPIFRSTRGRYNFDTVRYEYYRDRDVAFEGFTGKNYLYPRGIHLARLGDALRFSRRQGRPRQARDAARRNAVRRAGLVHQHAPRQVQGPPRARGADLRVRFRMDQQEPSCTAPTSARIRCSRIRT